MINLFDRSDFNPFEDMGDLTISKDSDGNWTEEFRAVYAILAPPT